MDAILLVFLLVGAVGGAVACAVLSIPCIVLGTKSARKEPARRKQRAIPWAIGSGAACSFGLSAAGFVAGAGVGDENAGAIAAGLWTIGAVFGFVVGAAMTWTIVVVRARA